MHSKQLYRMLNTTGYSRHARVSILNLLGTLTVVCL